MVRPPGCRPCTGAVLCSTRNMRSKRVSFVIPLFFLVICKLASPAGYGSRNSAATKLSTPSRSSSSTSSGSSSNSGASKLQRQQYMLEELPPLSTDANGFIEEQQQVSEAMREEGSAGRGGEGDVYYLKKTQMFRPTKSSTNKLLRTSKWKRKRRYGRLSCVLLLRLRCICAKIGGSFIRFSIGVLQDMIDRSGQDREDRCFGYWTTFCSRR